MSEIKMTIYGTAIHNERDVKVVDEEYKRLKLGIAVNDGQVKYQVFDFPMK